MVYWKEEKVRELQQQVREVEKLFAGGESDELAALRAENAKLEYQIHHLEKVNHIAACMLHLVMLGRP